MNFDELLKIQSLGLFQSIELVEIIGISAHNKNTPFAIFTLAIAQETPCPEDNQQVRLTDKLIEISKDLKVGIFKSTLSIDDFLLKIQKLEENIWDSNQGNFLNYSQLKKLPSVFAPNTDNHKNEYLGLLKNNFFSGSHIFEWFDESKANVISIINDVKVLEKLSLEVKKYIPIQLSTHSDRLGNFILQIPCLSISVNIKKERKDYTTNNLILNLATHPDISEDVDLTGIFWRDNHHSMLDFQKIKLVLGDNVIPFKHINGRGYYTILDNKNDIICAGGVLHSFLENMNFSLFAIEHYQRIFNLPSGEEQRVTVSTTTSKNTIGRSEQDYRDWTYARTMKLDRQNLQENLTLAQFKQGMRIEALDFIRRLIKKYGKNGVYIWDPYLSTDDLLETVFFTETANAPIKALTGMELTPEQDGSKSTTLTNYQNKLSQSIQQSAWLNLTFVKAASNSFHDRFIIFPRTMDNSARAWSLGTSVNSLGKSHHIILEVPDGSIIEDMFNEMWQQSIQKQENVIWQSQN